MAARKSIFVLTGTRMQGSKDFLPGFGAHDGSARGRMRRRGAEILHGPAGRFAEYGCGVERPVRIAEHLAGEEDEVGVAFGDDGVGLLGISDHADSGGGNCGFGTDARGKGCLESGTNGDDRVRNLAAGGAIDEVDPMGAEMAGKGDGVINGPAAFNPIGG